MLQPMSLPARPWFASLALVMCLPSCSHGDAPPPQIPPPGASAPLFGEHHDDDFDDFEEDEIPEVAGDDVVQSIVRLGHTDNQVSAHLEYLTEKIGPRLTSSHALMDAEVWTRDQFAKWGLKAELERWGDFPVGFDRGPWSGGMVAPEKVDFDFITPSWSPGVFGTVRGPAVAYPKTAAEAKSKRATYKGAWLVRPAKFDLPKKVRDAIDKELAKAEIAGVVRPDNHASGELVHTWGRSKVKWGEMSDQVTILLRGNQHADLVKRMDGEDPVELEFSVDNRFFRGPVPQHNVVADLVGSEKPDEFVIVGGHLDSWDGATGANDNGTGVATTMEAARLLVESGARPKRTIRFVLWTGEEQGLLGSRGYVETHGEEMDKTSAVFVHDMGTNYLSGIGVTPEMRPQMEQVFAPVMQLSPDEMPFALRDAKSLETGGSDHTPFIRAGVPGFFWDQDGDSDYWRLHHTQHDVIGNVVEEYQEHSAMVVAIAAYQVANLPDLIDRTNSAPIPRRRLGVSFGDELVIEEVIKKGAAAKAGWKVGDKPVSIEGNPIDKPRAFFRALQEGSPKKTVVVERKGKQVTTTLDWSDTPGEEQREARRRAREK